MYQLSSDQRVISMKKKYIWLSVPAVFLAAGIAAIFRFTGISGGMEYEAQNSIAKSENNMTADTDGLMHIIFDAPNDNEPEQTIEMTGAEKVSVILGDKPPVLQSDQSEIHIITKPSKIIKIDPEWAEKLRKGGEEKKQPLKGIFKTVLAAAQTEEALELNFSIENISGEDQYYYSGSSQRYDFSVYDSQGNEVYRWSNNMCFLTVITETIHKKGETISFSETWDYSDNKGIRVPPGEYSIVVRIIARRDDGRAIDPDELTATEYFIID